MVRVRKRAGRKFRHRNLDLSAGYRKILDNVVLLSADEEQELARRIQNGDQDARQRMILANTRLVISVALKYRGLGLSNSDLIGEGNCGLIQAVDNYQPGRGARFATYATYYIKMAVRWAITQHAYTIRIPERLILLMARWRTVEIELWEKTGRRPSPIQIAEKLNMDEEQIARVLKAMRLRRMGFIKENTQDDWVVDKTNIFERIETEDDIRHLYSCLGKLDNRAKGIVHAHYGLVGGEPQSLRVIGKRERLSREWVRRLGDMAIEKLSEEMCAID